MSTAFQGTDLDSPGVTFIPPTMFKICLLSGIGLTLAFPWPLGITESLFQLVAGIILAFLAFAFMMWGHQHFRRVGTAVRTMRSATVLVTDGAFRFSRNPMYVGFLGILLGIGTAADSVWLVLSVFPMALYLRLYVIAREEAYMERTFGEAYRQYRRRVRRWL